jgi:hypothetical protein
MQEFSFAEVEQNLLLCFDDSDNVMTRLLMMLVLSCLLSAVWESDQPRFRRNG